MTTWRRRRGDRAEALVAERLVACGWQVVARNVAVGRLEVDILAVDPGPPVTLVAVEVRSGTSSLFGPPELRVDRAKVVRCYRALGALRAAGRLPDGRPLPRLAGRVDLVTVELDPSLGRALGGPRFRHLRGLEPAV
jgi:putative endonuclease